MKDLHINLNSPLQHQDKDKTLKYVALSLEK